ncbi:hypothetical protein OS189_09915 [Sulfitobacter sp. F26169L]|uniref:hypothetical protein n=1 Tax=Sulfitobacter sp. F26169L TaxID=2996015 RepID=UPI002260DE1D|nr:hypothetical protein [Sulfitobacter sp. F26169L]MCX7566656.1 hypothetical protein [Sulfitobacter sp. F26169L]
MKKICLTLLMLLLVPQIVMAQSVRFGDDTSEWADDGECDDRRFRGSMMASGLDKDDTGHDATDCKSSYNLGELKVWNFKQARAATQCDKINFGDDKSDWPRDGMCDDYRFEGPGADSVVLKSDIGHDATDCRKLCNAGKIALRDY